MFSKHKKYFPVICFIIGILFLISMVSSFAQTFTLEQVMGVPFPSNLISSPSGDKFAWVFNDQGRRNIWTAQAPGYQARQLTNYDQDDGQELGELAFSRDGNIIVYVKGGATNLQGEHPNPTSDPQGADQAIWAIQIAGSDPWMLGKGSSPIVSPKGEIVVFGKGGKLYQAPIDSINKFRILFEAKGSNRSAVWSPDGSKLAFVSYRDDHSFIGIYDFSQNKITWMEPGVDRDQQPVWSIDGKQLAFIRFPGVIVEPSRRRGMHLPFELWIVDAETGTGQKIWTCPDSSGGFAQSYPAHPLMWGVDDRLVFYSEHDGWMHLYSVSLKDGIAICLTPGEYEVEDCMLSPDRRTVIFSSNKDDIDRRHLWAVDVKGGKLKRLTQGTGIEWSPVATNSVKDLVFLCSTASQPAAPAIMNIEQGNRHLITQNLIPEIFSLNQLIEPQQFIFQAPDGLDIYGQLFMPRSATPGDKRPAVIFMHGGPIRQMYPAWHNRGYYHNCYAFNQYLANKGYVVLSVNFRSGIGYGRAFRTAANQGPRGALEYQDIVAAARYLQSRLDVDPNKIGLWGGSYGGYLTALGLARDSELFAAGVDLHGVHDWSLRARRRDGGSWDIVGDASMKRAFDSSPVADARFWYSPVLFIHGDDDRNVDFIQTTDLVQRLRKEGKAHVELLVFPDEVHGFLLHKNWLRAFEAAADFFDRFLMAN
jgi:dipeptidyl aminopeptidase/acylaminoacyl peptidase